VGDKADAQFVEDREELLYVPLEQKYPA